MDELKALLEKHEGLTFPSKCYGKSIAGVNLVVVNSEIVAYIHTLIETGGKMSSRAKKDLLVLLHKLPSIIDEVEGEAKEYFQSLLDLGRAVGLE